MKDNFPDEAKEKTSKQEEMVAESSALYAAPEVPAAPDELSARNYFEKFLDQRFVAIEIKINSLKELFQHTLVQVDRRFERIDKRLEEADLRFKEMQTHFDQRFNQLLNKIDVQYRWVIGLIAGTFLTILGTILVKLFLR